MNEPAVSVVVPIYNNAKTINQLVEEIIAEVASIGKTVEIILVDDRSPDDAWRKICELSKAKEQVVGLRLSRNFGQHAAIAAGLKKSCGGKVVVMDGDLQDPPAFIPVLLRAANEVDVVLARRVGNYQSRTRKFLGILYFKMYSMVSGSKIDPAEGGFCAIDRKVVDAFLMFKERDRHFLFVIRWLGFSRVAIDYERPDRFEGSSSYGLLKRLKHAWSGLMFQTTSVLVAVTMFGAAVGIFGGVLATYVVWKKITGGLAPGWASTMALMLVGFGCVVFLQGIVGLYVAHTFEEAKQRPYFVVDEIAESKEGF
jgi:polyisoprenyl-phosphate glycosyltransferase